MRLKKILIFILKIAWWILRKAIGVAPYLVSAYLIAVLDINQIGEFHGMTNHDIILIFATLGAMTYWFITCKIFKFIITHVMTNMMAR